MTDIQTGFIGRPEREIRKMRTKAKLETAIVASLRANSPQTAAQIAARLKEEIPRVYKRARGLAARGKIRAVKAADIRFVRGTAVGPRFEYPTSKEN